MTRLQEDLLQSLVLSSADVMCISQRACALSPSIPSEFSMPRATVDRASHGEYMNAESEVPHYGMNEANSIVYHSHKFHIPSEDYIICCLVALSMR